MVALALNRPRGRHAEDRFDRRADLWQAAAPELRRLGYRGVTIKRLARTCHLAPASLYHYFASKEHLVLYPLQPDADYCERAVAQIELLPPDPKRRLNGYLEVTIRLHVDLMLVAELATEAGLQQRYRAALIGKYDKARLVLTGLIAAVYPALPSSATRELAERVVALVAGWYSSGRGGGSDSILRACRLEIEAAARNLIEN